ncbi:endolysin [Bacillus phage 000TH010]|uniref:Endolysin n=1 Tax=Bacillus phage 000TH010 TaxID=2601652 RepID=A0A5P8PHQ8_9CAUD|nr:endolysin [Bacillus phage 000TH010]QFR56246.1 endolysin [Bacillus phage 000TH010]
MSKLVWLDAGHGGKDSGAAANGIKEKDIVLKIVKKVKSILTSRYEVAVKLTRESDVFYELIDRARKANAAKADLFVSVHINATPGGKGFETYRYVETSASSSTGQQQKVLHDAIYKRIKKYGIKDRGEKAADLSVLRNTSMPAILTENLFIDNKDEAALLKKDSFLDAVAEGHAEGIAEILNLKKKSGGSDEKEDKPSSGKTKLAVVKKNSDGWLWVYNKADWSAKYKKVKPGEAFTIDKTVTVSGSKMYKLKSGLYITASSKYVTVKEK